MNTFDLQILLQSNPPQAFPGFRGVKLQLYTDVKCFCEDDIIAHFGNYGYRLYNQCTLEDNLSYLFGKEKETVQLYYCKNENKVRVIRETDARLPNFEKQSVENRCPVRFWQFEVDHSLIDCGMCYILQMSDYRYVVIDSGHFYSVKDSDRLYALLRENTPNDLPVTIAAWFFTHGHVDHIATYMAMLADKKPMNIEGLYINFIPDEHPDSIYWMDSDRIHTRRFIQDVFDSDIPVYIPHSFWRFFIGEIQVDILCTFEDVLPEPLQNYNDSSLVFKLTIDKNTVLIPGDAGAEESKLLELRTPKSLSCDILQEAHHAHFGTSEQFYRLANAPVLLCPSTKIKYDEEYPRYRANQTAQAIAKHLFIASDGTVEFTFPLKDSTIVLYPDETFENFEGIYNLWSYEYTDEFKQNLKKRFESRKQKQYIPY